MSEPIQLKCGVNAEVVPLDGRPGGHLRLSLYAYPRIHPQHFPITREEAVALARQLLDAAGAPAWEPLFPPRTLRWSSANPSPTNLSKSEPADPPAPTWRDRPPLL